MKKQIRHGVFETNSSSTHCLTFEKDKEYELHEELFTKEYVIKPWTDDNKPPYVSRPYDLILTSIEDKLTYFLTMYYQNNYYDYMQSGQKDTEFMYRLQKLFPNTVFALRCDDTNRYILEDGEWLYSELYDGTCDIDNLMNLNDNEFKLFMEYGIIYFGDRNFEPYRDFLDYELDEKNIIVKFSG